MKLLMGLGNPGSEYEMNRHNVGFMFVNYLYKNNTVLKPWKFDKYFHAEIAEITLSEDSKSSPILLAKPQTFMNKSGESLIQLVIRHTLVPADVCIAHDDLDILFGEFKINPSKGPKLHNGLKSIEEHWKTAEFWRIRIGVENRNGLSIQGAEYVLRNFLPEESQKLDQIFKSITEHPLFPLQRDN